MVGVPSSSCACLPSAVCGGGGAVGGVFDYSVGRSYVGPKCDLRVEALESVDTISVGPTVTFGTNI